jgi:hypothetical protein
MRDSLRAECVDLFELFGRVCGSAAPGAEFRLLGPHQKCAHCGIIRAIRESCPDDPQPGPDAHRLFTAQPTKEKRSLLNFLLSNSTWVRGKLSVEFKEPFDLLIETSRPPNASKRPRERIGRKRGLAELPAFELDLRAGQALSEVQGTL